MIASHILQPVAREMLSNQTKHPHLLTGLDGSSRSLMIASLFKESPEHTLIVEPIESRRTQLVQDLQSLLPQVPIHTFIVEDSLAVEFSYQSHDLVAERVEALNALIQDEPCIVLTNLQGIRKPLSDPRRWKSEQLTFEMGTEIEMETLERTLLTFGYHREAMVEQPGQFSVRGGIVDYFPFDSDFPIRLDFFDTELDSIRYFNFETQESVDNATEVKLTPVTDVLFSTQDQQQLLPVLKKHLTSALNTMKDEELKRTLEKGMTHQLEALEHDEPLKFPQAYLTLLTDQPYSLLNYLPNNGRLIVMEFDKLLSSQNQSIEEENYWIEQEVVKGQLLPGLDIKLDGYHLLRQDSRLSFVFATIQRGLGNMSFASIQNFHYRAMTPFFNQLALFKEEVAHWQKQNYTIDVVVGSLQEAKRTATHFEEEGIGPVVIQSTKQEPGVVNIAVANIQRGFELPLLKYALVTEKELYNKQPARRVRSQKMSNAERIKSYNELKVGDYVVHVNHGIGKYTGMETIQVKGVHRDLLAIEYQNNARVMIPVDQLHLIQKYIGSEAKAPRLHKLGGTEWTKTKQRVASTVEDIADELIALYAEREAEKGYAFSPDTPEQKEFEDAFPYVETDDQLKSTSEIKVDMEKERPMDRLLVGDVGYGKTEVAMRAIFKAVMDGKQVAFLVPTTILAQQHYQSLVERFADYPFEIGLLSRFVTRKEQNETIEGLKIGAISIVVGTHRLLSKDIKFNDLGLLVVDEEQRFGVKHKERLKQLKANVDVLTLTATPIPRTLNMAMMGVRDLSVIETPPQNRYPVQTYIMERNEGAIKSAIEREMDRGGQVFYLYNRVDTIHERAAQIQELVPDARIAVAHGQMTEVALETALIDFIQGEYDVLVTTTIIETGVDIPNANTLFIEDADRMGLSTLYQLRGRVGRTHRIAYAYLMYEPFKQLSQVSETRLQAMREFTELGSGFKIAMRDLSIRGAGNLLGQQQSGFIDSVGFDLYSQMLKEAVDKKRGIDHQDHPYETSELEWDIQVDAYIPNSYIEDERQKISFYKLIQQIDSVENYRNVQEQLIDRYGDYPQEVADLLEVALIKAYGLRAGIERIKQQSPLLFVWFSEKASAFLKGPNIFEALKDIPLKAQVQMDQDRLKLQLTIQGQTSQEWLAALRQLVEQTEQLMDKQEEDNET